MAHCHSRHASDASRAFKEDGALKTHIGGQALIEGIMMRGRYNWSVAVREPLGSIYVEDHDIGSGQPRHQWMHWPLIRGCTSLVESLTIGYKALEIAATHAFDDEDDDNDQPADVSASSDNEGDSDQDQTGSTTNEASFGSQHEITIALVMGLVLGIVLFIVLPALITNLIVGEYDSATLTWNIVDGLLRIGVFIGYLWLIGRMKDVRRMFGYHGAEHKTIHCFEHGLPLTPDNARSFPRLHVRCGTAFLLMVMVIAIFVYAVTPINALISAWGIADGAPKLLLVIAIRIVLMPVIAGVSYEVTVRWAGRHPSNPLVKIILWPGMQMQYLTTREPDDGELECAIAAMQHVVEREEREEA
ncbi:MAG: DUF1385 domain-containing protein [Eggerthellaceae bacterium]|jgi:uncharacterized protein YqhQ|nr:DUF1385 domain-containing protein [Eggerthellaceae bacterium]MCH4221477.1 DUF1385 domain-containing protein [Eggerthellaceae bacterium]